MGVEGDVRRSDEDGAEGGVMSHERRTKEGIIANFSGMIDDKSKREVEASASTASIASLTGRFVMPVERVAVPLLAHCRFCWAPAKRSVATWCRSRFRVPPDGVTPVPISLG